MRLWSIDFKLLDSKGLVALWRETLLAKNVLEGNTVGYKNHPQLLRFKESPDPAEYINYYLSLIYKESQVRGYNFNSSKFRATGELSRLNVTSGQIEFELNHLQNKLKVRDRDRFLANLKLEDLRSNNLFKVIPGEVESWEKV